MSQSPATKTIYMSVAANVLLAVVKGISGILGNSYALVADAIESATDVFSSMLVLLGLRYAQRPADENHPYGHGKIEPLVTFAVVAIIVVSATIIVYESIAHIQTPHDAPEPWTLVVLGVIIIWKEISFRYVRKRSRETNSTSLLAEAWHHRSDAITSVMAFIGISLALILGEGYEAADDWAALLASGLLLFNSYLIFRPALGEIMDEHRYDEMIDKIRAISANVEGVLDTEKCLVRKTGMKFHVDLHAVVDGQISVAAGHRIAHDLQDALKDEMPQLESVLIHVEPDSYDP